MSVIRRRFGPAAVVALTTSIGIAGCGRGHPAAIKVADPCFPAETTPALAADTVVLGISAPGPAEDHGLVDPATRFLEAVSQVPLVRIDCHGRPVPAMAVSWSRDETGVIWTFSLAAGRSLGAAIVRDRWRDAGGGNGWPWPEIADVTALDGELLQVRLIGPRRDLPVEFADRRLAVESPTLGPPVRVATSPPDFDQRNLLDPGSLTRIDLLFSRDPVTIDYARGRPEWRVIPLPWDRVYSLVTVAPLLEDLAGGVALVESVRGDARVPAGPFWWSVRPQCDLRPEPRSESPRPEVGYSSGDGVAQDLAERMVAIGVPPRASRLRAVPLDPARLAIVLDEGQLAGAIVADPGQAPLGCLPRPLSTRGPYRYPLVETRAHLIVRRGVGPLTIDRDGTVRFLSPGHP